MNRHQEKKTVQFFLLSSFIGLIVALYTLWHHVSINGNGLEKASFCSVNEYINCDAVALSSYSSVAGYPVAALLVIFYGVLLSLGLSLYFGPSDSTKTSDQSASQQLRRALFTLCTVAMIPTIFLAGVSFFVLKLLCVLCLTSYLINLLLWFFAFRLKKQNPPGTAFGLPPKSTWMGTAVIAAVLAISPLMVRGMVGGGGLEDSVVSTVLYQHFTAKPVYIASTGFPSIGPEDAKVVVVEYSDFQCPFCARASTVVPEVVRATPGAKFVFKNFPLDASCNPSMQGRGHALACIAAKTGHCVFVGKGNAAFFDYEKSIFAQQSTLSTVSIESAGLQSGLSKEELKTCLESPETHAAIVAQANEGKAVGVTGTPAVFVNGRRLEYGTVAKVLKAVLDRYTESPSNAGK